MVLDLKAYRLTDRQSQCNFDFDGRRSNSVVNQRASFFFESEIELRKEGWMDLSFTISAGPRQRIHSQEPVSFAITLVLTHPESSPP
jgi:hypothetical protein